MNKNYFLGKKKTQKENIDAEIIEFYNAQNITIRFNDGYILKRQLMRDFINGELQHPGLRQNHTQIQNHKIYPVFTGPSGEQYYTTICIKCRYRNIQTYQQIANHICEVTHEERT